MNKEKSTTSNNKGRIWPAKLRKEGERVGANNKKFPKKKKSEGEGGW
jgi:hypothetical protein